MKKLTTTFQIKRCDVMLFSLLQSTIYRIIAVTKLKFSTSNKVSKKNIKSNVTNLLLIIKRCGVMLCPTRSSIEKRTLNDDDDDESIKYKVQFIIHLVIC